MMKGKHTIVFESKGTRRKLFKLWYGSDGSYYVTVPYHPAKKAILFKQTINYRTWRDGGSFRLEQAIDVASSDDTRIKLSHHPDGFIQFSGSGVLSGKNPDGSIKGIGVDSWPLRQGCRGPAFGVSVFGVDDFEPADDSEENLCIFSEEEVNFIPGMKTLVIEGHYFPIRWRRFIQRSCDGIETIPIIHPAGVVLNLRVLLPNDQCPIGGFFGLEMFWYINKEGPQSGFCLSSSTGNLRKNEEGHLLGDELFCIYPREDWMAIRRSVDYRPRSSPQ